MSTFELAPTIENFIQTLNDNIVNRNDDVVNFYRFRQSIANFITESPDF